MLRHIALVSLLALASWVTPAFGVADGPDFYAVTGVATDDVLNLRAGPSPDAEQIGQIAHDARGLQNLGCQGLPSFAEWEQMTQPEREKSRQSYWCKVRYQGVEGWVAGRFLREDSAPAQAAMPGSLSSPTPAELGNIAYAGIYAEPVQLVNGVYEGEPFVPGGAARPRVELLAELYVTADIDGDGSEDAFVLLNESSGGSGQFLYLAAVTHAEGNARNVGTVAIGDRVDVMALRGADGKATLEYVAAGPGEPACCPTSMVSSVYGLDEGGGLAELSREQLGTLSVERLAGPPWRLAGLGWNESVPQGVSATAKFEGDRVSGSAGCNRYFATLQAPTPYELSIGRVVATRRACPPTQMEVEHRFLEALQNATQFSFVLGRLAIAYKLDDAHSVLVFGRGATD